MSNLRDKAAIIGIGETPYSRGSGMSEMALLCHVAAMAADDAGISVRDIDGFVCPTIVAPPYGELETNLGVTPAFTSYVPLAGASSTAGLLQAAAAIEAGIAKRVLVAVARNDYSAPHRRKGTRAQPLTLARGNAAFEVPFGWIGEASHYAMMARMHMNRYGTTSEQLGAVAVATRKHACLNEHAQMRTPITLEDHQYSRMIADPFRLLDCSVISDGAACVIVAPAAEARDRRKPPVYIAGAAQGIPPTAGDLVNRPDILRIGAGAAAAKAFAMADCTPADIDVCEIYDCFTYVVIRQLEEMGFCAEGEGGAFVEDGRIELGGALPVNTHGGLLSQGHMSGMNHIVEAVRQVRGEAGAAQVPDVRHALVTGFGGHCFGSVAILRS